MHDLQFADSIRQSPVRILRLAMLPYSLGHELILLAQRNPLLLLAEEDFNTLPFTHQRLAIIRAALVCYRTWNQNATRERNLMLWGWLTRKSHWSLEIAQFRNYRESGSTCPPSPSQRDYEIANGLQNEETGRDFGGSQLARLLNFSICIYRSVGAETPYDVPFGLLNHLYFSKLEIDGNARIENAKETQVRLEMAEHEAAIKKDTTPCQP